MGCASEFLEHGPRCSHKIAVMVMGELADCVNASVRVCYEATSDRHHLDMHQCTLDGEPCDWLLSRDKSEVLFTDVIC